MECGSRPFLQPIWDLQSPSIVFGRIVLIGDAAFVARPHVATGVSKAALDVQSLVDALAQESGLDAALVRYAREREHLGRALVARGRHLGGYIRPAHEVREPAYAASHGQRIAVLLHEYGAAGVIRDPD
jgi:2-polyprenyl-6-methoxyphenol hydroxylase-like FAD-dependent oxidoreductase